MSNQSYNGDISFNYKGETYEAGVGAQATYTFIKGRKYMANGDPGWPDEEDFEIDNIDVYAVFKYGVEVPYEEGMYDAIESALKKADWEEEDRDPPEPDDDYYEERAMARWEAECDRFGV